MNNTKRKRRHLRKQIKFSLYAILIVILSVLILITTFYFKQRQIRVIDFTNQSLESFEIFKENNAINDNQVTYIYEYSDKVVEGYIIRQSLKSGEILSINNGITIYISRGSQANNIELPDLSNWSLNQIIDWKENNNVDIDINVEKIYDPNQINNSIKSIDIIDDSDIDIKIYSNDFNSLYKQKDYSNYSLDLITKWASNSNLKYKIIYIQNDKYEYGTIIDINKDIDEFNNQITLIVLSSGKYGINEINELPK